MRRFTILKSLLLLCALVAGSSSVWAEEVLHYTLDGTETGGSSGYATESDITQDGISWKVTANTTQNPWRIGGQSITDKDRPMYSTTAMGSAITKIEVSTGAASNITVNSVKLIVSTASDGGGTKIDEITKTSNLAPSKTITFTPTSPLTEWATGAYYKIIFNVTVSGSSNKFVVFNSAKFYKEKIDITSISLPSTESVGVGGKVTLTPTVTPANYNEAIDWESDATGVATVNSSGVVTGVSAGTAHITAKSHGNPSTIYDVCTVTVTAPIAVTGVSLNKTSLDMHFGDTETLNPTIAPATATNKDVSWESDDTKVATVSSDGLVTAVGPGTCTITVTTDDGDFTATCDVTVTIESIDLSAPIIISDWDAVKGDIGYYDTYINLEGYTYLLTQCMKNSSVLQIKASAGILTSPTINSTNGFTLIIETADGSNDAGVLTVQIGSETAQTVTGKNKTLIVKTDATSTSFTVKNLSSKVMQVSKISIVPNQYSTTVQSYGWATFIAPAPVQFAANTAYVVTAASVSAGLTLKAITEAPAGTPLLLKGAGDKDITVLTTAPAAPATNLLSIGTGTTPDGKYPYVLAKDGEGACFKQWTGTAATLTGRVVLLLNEAVASSSPVFSLDGNTTGISQIENGQMTIDNSEVYNLNGQRVAQPTKGLYIVNGKKYIVK